MQLGPYRLDRVLGAGGMGEVWRATHERLALPAVVKFPVRAQPGAPRSRALNAAIEREALLQARLDHPGIVRVYERGTVTEGERLGSEGRFQRWAPWFAMEYAPGAPLERWMGERFGSFGWSDLRAILLQLLDALAHAHARGVLHLDLKASNVLVQQDPGAPPRTKLTDFGAAQRYGGAVAPSGGLGSWRTMAPERFLEQAIAGPGADIYSLGCVAHELATSHPPFQAGSFSEYEAAHREGRRRPWPRWLSWHAPVGVESGLKRWIDRALAIDPSDRFVSAAHARAALEALSQPKRSAPVGALRLEGAAQSAAGLPLFSFRERRFSGREDARQALADTLDAAIRERSPRLVSLRGAGRGAGVSALTQWFLEFGAARRGALGIEVRFSASPRPSDGLSRALLRALGCGASHPRGLKAQLVRALAWAGLGEADCAGAARLLLSERGGEVEPLSYGERLGAWSALLEQLARARPLVLSFDDALFAGESLDLLRLLLASSSEAPVVIALAFAGDRAAEAAPFTEQLSVLQQASGARGRELEIGWLDDEEIVRLLQDQLPLEEGLAEELARSCEGSPARAISALAHEVRAGLCPTALGLARVPGRDPSLPPELAQRDRERIESAIAALGERWAALRSLDLASGRVDAASAIQLAAAMGREVLPRELRAALVAGENPIELWLLEKTLFERGLARPRVRGRGWRFASDSLVELIATSARRAGRWGALNAACARALAPRASDPEIGERIGLHLAEAGEHERSFEHLLEAARAARRRSLYQLAARRLSTCDDRLKAASCDDDRRWCELHRLRLQCLYGMGRYAEAAEAGRLATAHARRKGWVKTRYTALRLRGMCAYRAGDYTAALAFLERAHAWADRAGDRNEQVYCALHLSSVLLREEDPAGALTLAQEAAALHAVAGAANEHERLVRGAEASTYLGIALLKNDELDAAERHITAALAKHRAARSDYGVARCVNTLANLRGQRLARAGAQDPASRRDALAEIAEGYGEALRLFELRGSPAANIARINLALVLLERGDARAAEPFLTGSLGVRWAAPSARFALLLCCAERADWSGWDEHWRATALQRTRPDIDKALIDHLDRAAALCRSGDGRRAGAVYELLGRWFALQSTAGAAERAHRYAARAKALIEEGP